MSLLGGDVHHLVFKVEGKLELKGLQPGCLQFTVFRGC